MKKLLFLLLLVPMLAKAQFPAPTGVAPFGSALFLYKIIGGDTLVYARSSNGLYFPVGRGSGTGGAFLPLTFRSDNQVRIGSHNFLMTSDTVGGQFYFFQHNDAGVTLESSTSRWSAGFSINGFSPSFGIKSFPSGKTIGWRGDTTGFVYSDKVNKIPPRADSLYSQVSRLDVALWGNVVDTILAKADSVKSTVQTFYNSDGSLVTGGGFRNVYLSGNEIDFTGSSHNFVVYPTGDIGVGAAPGQSNLGYSLDIFQSGTLGMFQAGNLAVNNSGLATTATQAARDSSFKLASTQYVDKAVHAGGGSVASVFGRTGTVVAATNDYTFAQIGSKPTTLSGYGITDAVPASRTITINGTAFDLSANRSWTVGSTITPVSGETPTGLMNGSNVTFTSAHTPIAGSLNIVYNGLILQPTVDYTFSGTTATLVLTGHLSGAPVSTDYLLFNYQY